jgi:hypothetical protein
MVDFPTLNSILLDKGIETPIPGISAFAGARKTVDNKNIKDNDPKTKEERNLFCGLF